MQSLCIFTPSNTPARRTTMQHPVVREIQTSTHSRIDSDARIQSFFLQISVYQKNGDHSKNQPQHKIQRKLRSLFHKPSRPDFVDLYIFLPVTQIFVSYDGNNRKYFFSLPGYSLSGCIFLPVFLYTVTNSPAKAVRIPGISNVTTLSVREEHT